MSTDLRVAAGRQWVTAVVFGVLGLELAAIVTLAASCLLVAGLAFGGFMAWQPWKTTRWRPEPEPLEREGVTAGAGTR